MIKALSYLGIQSFDLDSDNPYCTEIQKDVERRAAQIQMEAWYKLCDYLKDHNLAIRDGAVITDAEKQPGGEPSVELIDMAQPTYNGLHRNNIHTIPRLLATSETDLLQMAGIGSASVKDIKRSLAKSPWFK